jgi:hypothetical protein
MRWNRESLLGLRNLLERTIEAGIGPKSVTCDGGACVAVSARSYDDDVDHPVDQPIGGSAAQRQRCPLLSA